MHSESKRFPIRAIATGLVLLQVSACSNMSPAMRERTSQIEGASVESAPIVAPVRSASVFRDGLVCMDRLLRDQNFKTTLITSKIIPDASGLVSVSVKDMIITALSQMSATSNAFRFVDYEVDALKQDTVQNLTGLLLNSGQIDLPKPQIYVSGSISYGDRAVVSRRSSLGVASENIEGSYSWDTLATVYGLDLHLGDMGTRTLLMGIDAANEAVAATAGRGFAIGGRVSGLPKYIYKLGVDYDMYATASNGAGAATRALVDLSAIELIGKWARVPYWQCLQFDQGHPEFQRQMREWYDEMPVSERVAMMQRGLKVSGFYAGDIDGKMGRAMRAALAEYQSTERLVINGHPTFETYERLLRNYVAADGAGKFIRIGWGKVDDPAYNATHDQVPRNGALPLDSGASAQLQVNLTTGRRDIDYNLGEAIQLNVATSRNAYLNCYYVDSLHQTWRLYPNPFQFAQPVQGNRAVNIPPLFDPNSFVVEASAPGAEGAVCFASETDIASRLPEELRSSKFAPIPGYESIDALITAVDERTIDLIPVKSLVKWQNQPQK
jgi:hypothetical protein